MLGLGWPRIVSGASRSAVTISRAWNLFNSQKNSSASDRIERFTEAIVYDIDKRGLVFPVATLVLRWILLKYNDLLGFDIFIYTLL